ncbi:MAG: T9SS type A sorting domain-containing protein, partial [Ignavibacteria bacterium]
TYNATNNDPVYGPAPPAVGFAGMRGALIFTGNNNDTAFICRNKTKISLPRYKDMGLTVIRWVAKHDPILWGEPNIYWQTYRVIQGKLLNGSNIVHPNGYVTTFSHTGDPVNGTGWLLTGPADHRFMVSTGPVNMNPGDTQVIVIAQVIARGTSNLNSITALRQTTIEARNYYKSCYTSVPIGIEPISNQVPMSFKLHQNFPNPFNPVTKIKFDIAKSSISERGDKVGTVPRTVRLITYDILGREVAVLVNEQLKPGTYEVEWDGTNYPSGIYLYKLITDDFTQANKMVLIK